MDIGRMHEAGGMVLRRCCGLSLTLLVVAIVLSACGLGRSAPTCTAGLAPYKGNCVTPATVAYLGCIEGKGKNLSQGVEVGGTLPAAANATLKVAYKRAKEQGSAADLQIVKDCLALAREGAPSEAAGVRDHEEKVVEYSRVVEQKLPAIELEPSGTIDCPSATVGDPAVSCPSVTVRSTGLATLRVSRVRTTGGDSDEFTASGDCEGQPLNPGQTCEIRLEFKPVGDGQRNATLVVHQNLPSPDTGTRLRLTGLGEGGQQRQHMLEVVVSDPAAIGAVESLPAGIACSSTCSASFDDDMSVTLEATLGQVSSWHGCDAAHDDLCTVRMTADRRVTVHFSP